MTVKAPSEPRVVTDARERVHAEYGGAIGRHRTELTTPALVLDRKLAAHNISQMGRRLADTGGSIADTGVLGLMATPRTMPRCASLAFVAAVSA